MAENSKIEWTDHTFNPWIGCTKVSDGCKFCYAETLMDERYGKAKWGPKGTRNRTSESYWKQPHKWNRDAERQGVRKRVFCASLADVFEGPETMPDDAWVSVSLAREDIGCLIDATPWLDWLLLTKRPENVLRYGPLGMRWTRGVMPQNVWIGTSVEDSRVIHRIDALRRIPAKVRFLSIEPLIGGLGVLDLTGIDWVIVGGESGPHARPMHPHWVQDIRDQCIESGTPFFFKQWGEWAPTGLTRLIDPHDRAHIKGDFIFADTLCDALPEVAGVVERMKRVGKRNAGRRLYGMEWSQLPSIVKGD